MFKSKLSKLIALYRREIFVIAIICIGYIVTHSHLDSTSYYVNDIRMSFSGKVSERYVAHGHNIKIRSLNETIHTYDVAGDFFERSRVGDSVYKPKDSNYIYIIQKDTILRLQYLSIPNVIVSSKNWPADLKCK